MIHRVPEPCDTERRLHGIDLRERNELNWGIQHQTYNERWDERRTHIDMGHVDEHGYDSSYILWYQRITRRYITQHGALYDLMTESLNNINNLTLDDTESSWIIPRIRNVCEATAQANKTSEYGLSNSFVPNAWSAHLISKKSTIITHASRRTIYDERRTSLLMIFVCRCELLH